MASIRISHWQRSERGSIRRTERLPRTKKEQRRSQSTNDTRALKVLFGLAGLKNATAPTFAGVLLVAFLAILIKLSAGESAIRESSFESVVESAIERATEAVRNAARNAVRNTVAVVCSIAEGPVRKLVVERSTESAVEGSTIRKPVAAFSDSNSVEATTVRNTTEPSCQNSQQSQESQILGDVSLIRPSECSGIQNSTRQQNSPSRPNSQQKDAIQDSNSQENEPTESSTAELAPPSQSPSSSQHVRSSAPNPTPEPPVNAYPESRIEHVVIAIPTPLPQPGDKGAPFFRGDNLMSFQHQYRQMVLRHDTPDRKAAALVEDYCAEHVAFEVRDLYTENDGMSLRELFEAMKPLFVSMGRDRLLSSPRCLPSFVDRWIQSPNYTIEGYLLNFKALVSRARQYGITYDESIKAYELLRGLQRAPEVQKRVCEELSIVDPILPSPDSYEQVVSFLEQDRQTDQALTVLNCTDFSNAHPCFEVR